MTTNSGVNDLELKPINERYIDEDVIRDGHYKVSTWLIVLYRRLQGTKQRV